MALVDPADCFPNGRCLVIGLITRRTRRDVHCLFGAFYDHVAKTHLRYSWAAVPTGLLEKQRRPRASEEISWCCMALSFLSQLEADKRGLYIEVPSRSTQGLRELAASFCVTLPFDRTTAQASLLPPPPPSLEVSSWILALFQPALEKPLPFARVYHLISMQHAAALKS